MQGSQELCNSFSMKSPSYFTVLWLLLKIASPYISKIPSPAPWSSKWDKPDKYQDFFPFFFLPFYNIYQISKWGFISCFPSTVLFLEEISKTLCCTQLQSLELESQQQNSFHLISKPICNCQTHVPFPCRLDPAIPDPTNILLLPKKLNGSVWIQKRHLLFGLFEGIFFSK